MRYIRSLHRYAFRSGQWAEILTVVPSHGRDCYLVRYEDGFIDWVPVDAPGDQREYR